MLQITIARPDTMRARLRAIAWFLALFGLALSLFGAQAPVTRADCSAGEEPLRPCLEVVDHDNFADHGGNR